MAIAAVLSSASTTNIRWFLWLFYFLSLFMSQSCLADHDQFNFYHGRLFSRKLCPGRCSMKFELQPFFRDSTVSESMHLSASSNPKRNRASKMYLSVSAAALVLIAVSSTWHMRRRDALFEEEQENIREPGLIESGEDRSGNDDNSHDNLRRKSETQMVFERRRLFQLDVIRKFKKYFSFKTKVEFQGLPSFPLKVILKATQHFSDDRILGNGGFGVVYKGQLDDGGLIAVKRFSPSSRSAEHEFINEISTLPNLQHKNIVRILGYCIERDEKLLIYEFISNGTINDVLFGSSMDIRLAEWKTRKNIINGIARGLLYLHEDSWFRIFHRDIKPSNVLLDDNMNPKISNFELAMIFDEDEIQVDTIVGTFEYMALEYVMHGQLSVKTDVYSFGVLLLQIITGKKNADLFLEREMVLLGYVWKLWCEGQALDLIDPALKQSCENYNNELMRCIHIGLLCVQDNPTDRPTMSSVVVMLASDDVKLPEPKPIESAQFYSSDIEDMSVHEGSISSLTSNEGECAQFRSNGSKNMPKPNPEPIPIHDEYSSDLVVATPVQSSSDIEYISASEVTLSISEARSGNDDNSRDNLQRENQMVSEHRPVFPLDVIRKFKKYFSLETIIRNQVEAEAEFQGLPSVPFDVILKATQQFSDDRILGKGCFGVVYKGQLDDGGLIAVKRLSPSRVVQRCEDFINEVSTLPNLQHKNIVKILGYCIERDEKMLIYEFMSNRSLEDVLSGSSMGIRLAEWKTRKNIINGIARGLLYLHEDSWLEIIHRDIKPSNVLLDDNMNPKISDFGLAMIFDEDEIEDDRVAGTYGYIAPECFFEQQYTVKADVYSFGILLLEIITGKKNSTLLKEHEIHLRDYIWKLWCKGQALDLIDPALKQSCENYNNELMRCIHIGLLCIQEDPTDRPTMSSVVVMLASDDVKLPEPKPIHFLYSLDSVVATPVQSSSDIEYISASEGSITSNEGEYVHNFGAMEARICLSWTSFD